MFSRHFCQILCRSELKVKSFLSSDTQYQAISRNDLSPCVERKTYNWWHAVAMATSRKANTDNSLNAPRKMKNFVALSHCRPSPSKRRYRIEPLRYIRHAWKRGAHRQQEPFDSKEELQICGVGCVCPFVVWLGWLPNYAVLRRQKMPYVEVLANARQEEYSRRCCFQLPTPGDQRKLSSDWCSYPRCVTSQ